MAFPMIPSLPNVGNKGKGHPSLSSAKTEERHGPPFLEAARSNSG
jgi:hypothetical protein